MPTAVADLHEGETVLDLGSGAGADVLISARRVGATGTAIGLDMTDEMLELARANAADAGVTNVEFVKGYIEEIPLADASVDVIVSNCVLNLSADKPRVFAEAARVLRPGGRFAVSDVVADPDMDEATRADMAAYTGCIAGALTEDEFRAGLAGGGLRGHRGPPDASRARARQLGDHPRPQAAMSHGAARSTSAASCTSASWASSPAVCRSHADAEDIAQEVMLRIHRHSAELEHADRMTAWVYRIAANAIADHYRRPARRELPSGHAVDVPEPAGRPSCGRAEPGRTSCAASSRRASRH